MDSYCALFGGGVFVKFRVLAEKSRIASSRTMLNIKA